VDETRHYLGGMEFKDGVLEAYNFGDGRVVFHNSVPTLRFQYRLHDHLGNTVVFFEDKNNNGCITTEEEATSPADLEIVQRLLYYPFGMALEGLGAWGAQPWQQYRYNGKERDTLTGWYDYGARWGLLDIGRWNGVDPLAGHYLGISPYAYVLNNPIQFTDPDGRSVKGDIYNKNGVHIGNDGRTDDRVFVANTQSERKLTEDESLGLTLVHDFVAAFGRIEGGAGLTELPVSHSQFKEIAGTIYAEGTPWKLTFEEAAGIYSVMRNRAKKADRSVYDIAGSPGIYGWKHRDKINSPSAHKPSVLNAIKGSIEGMTNNHDYSGGGYYWHGSDFSGPTKGSTAHEDFYKVGFYFTKSSHDIWGLGNFKSGKKGWDYKYESTGVGGQTTFMKLTDQFINATEHKGKW